MKKGPIIFRLVIHLLEFLPDGVVVSLSRIRCLCSKKVQELDTALLGRTSVPNDSHFDAFNLYMGR